MRESLTFPCAARIYGAYSRETGRRRQVATTCTYPRKFIMRMRPDDRARLDELSRLRGLPRAQLIRALVREALEEDASSATGPGGNEDE